MKERIVNFYVKTSKRMTPPPLKHKEKTMKRKILIIAAAMLFFIAYCGCEMPPDIYISRPDTPPQMPFPQNLTYPDCFKPVLDAENAGNNQSLLNQDILDFYYRWKANYLRKSNGNTPGGGFYIEMFDAVGQEVPAKSCSEAHGYGMIIFALMAGADPCAQVYFDGMFNMFKQHPTRDADGLVMNENLMSWLITMDETTANDSDSATDGDLDIAYALLLAHRQWGSGYWNGKTIDYLAEAKKMITDGIKAQINGCIVQEFLGGQERLNLVLGNWTDKYKVNEDNYFIAAHATRPSDWLSDHFRAFYYATGDYFWIKLINQIYSDIDVLQTEYSPVSGLMPDFAYIKYGATRIEPAFYHYKNKEGWWFEETEIFETDGKIEGFYKFTNNKIKANVLEGPFDGQFSYNACRTPWRFSLDFAHYGEKKSRDAVNKMTTFIMKETDYDAYTIGGERFLDKDLEGLSGNDGMWIEKAGGCTPMIFTSSFVAASVIRNDDVPEASQKQFITDGWEIMTQSSGQGYFEDTVTALCLIFISGNWWAPNGTTIN